jgi:hypothetical protein
LSFEYYFKHVNDEVKCAYTVPYTYTALQAHLKQLKLLSKRSTGKQKVLFIDLDPPFIRFESLGTSLGSLDIPLLKVSNFDSANQR